LMRNGPSRYRNDAKVRRDSIEQTLDFASYTIGAVDNEIAEW
jgi:hypothetical protein